MRTLKFVLPTLLLLGFILFGSWANPFGSALPAIGKLFDPFHGFWQLAEPAFAEHNATFTDLPVSGRIVFDDRRVPHIFADNLEDAYYLQGFVTASDRLWQMDISVRNIEGRLAEVLGKNLIERDRRQRRTGYRHSALQKVAAWQKSEEDMRLLRAYCAGVNAYIDHLRPADYPLEFRLLNYAPERWTLLKSALFLQNMSDILAGGSKDVSNTLLVNLLGRDQFERLYPEYFAEDSPVIPNNTDWTFSPLAYDTTALPTLPKITDVPGYQPQEQPDNVGSNNWAIAGSRTASGAPLLANDPHLKLTLPSIWYEVQIHCPELNAYGVSLPALPGIIIGFNENAAWGVTNVQADVKDWYRIEWVNEEHTRYRLDGQEREVDWVLDTIYVKGKQKPIIERTPWTIHGPVVYDTTDNPYQGLAMRWLVLDRPHDQDYYEVQVFKNLMRAKSHEDYREALRQYQFPAQNFVFACRDGDIALQANGRFPLRAPQQGRFIQDGSRSATNLTRYIPMEQVPAVHNPERGFVSSANQRTTDASYPYYYLGRFAEYRGRYLNRRLSELEKATPADMKALQLDDYSLFAEEVLPLFLSHLRTASYDEAAAQAIADLKNWDYRYRSERKIPALFEQWWDAFYRLTLDELFDSPRAGYLSYPKRRVLSGLLDSLPADPIFDRLATDPRETAADIVTAAFDSAWNKLSSEYIDPEFDWATARGTYIRHLGQIAAFHSDLIKSGGSPRSLNAISSTNGPSWRMVVDLSEPVRAWGVFPGGASGNPGSKYYDLSVPYWDQGQYHDLRFWRQLPTPNQRQGEWIFGSTASTTRPGGS